ncbi:conserved hypothetical protein [Paecilomyces variotii No. 5]|uniref:DUF1754-domain-containing protein n=1 Tax=Byssochlamys spectabilis (strain No. 5 / NBRC 109023) TaxID=1356009 RepID=V5HYQ7_BYSSN|nr:conserved hypothetical protein [Paecilomyces variotii No. 5]
MAPGDEYSAVGGAGKLKLKGLKVKDGRVEKKKKKKEKKEHAERSRETSAVAESQQSRGEAAVTAEPEGDDAAPAIEKTEAEKRYEEMRRKRLNDRLKREGVKTHKERVEELNKYLSTLSEHHDMPKIGPG